ncbi:Uncharacterised protein [Mycobacteroides abscessus subsp. massiliense]|nr:Uncharacterised protein [Mycobacteroides abscessus subsp. massiliense]
MSRHRLPVAAAKVNPAGSTRERSSEIPSRSGSRKISWNTSRPPGLSTCANDRTHAALSGTSPITLARNATSKVLSEKGRPLPASPEWNPAFRYPARSSLLFTISSISGCTSNSSSRPEGSRDAMCTLKIPGPGPISNTCSPPCSANCSATPAGFTNFR